jgi:hypothetical protein
MQLAQLGLGAQGSPSGGLGGLTEPSTESPGGGTEYPYTTYDKPYSGVPEDMVTRFGITLQPGPMQSLIDIARESDLRRGAREIGMIGQGYRPYSAQVQGYNQSPGRFAPPGQSYHGQGLAIDAGAWSAIAALNAALLEAGWNQFSRSAEPWHYSYGVTG